MFGQPRCREWTPLATQQLRLRTLIQIVGYNIHEGDGSVQTGSLYYTLHTTTMSAPFYTSEKLLSNHPKWREIDSELIHKMSSKSVVVRIWRHTRHDLNSLHAPSDTIVQTWGVNFNGLLHIGANLALDFSPKSFKNNTLVFQMIGGYFCSYDSLKLEPSMKIPNVEQPQGVTAIGKEASPARKISSDKNTRLTSESKSISPGKSWKAEGFESRAISKSHSPPVGCFRQNYGSYKSSSSNLSYGNNRQEYYRGSQEGRERKRSDSYNSSIYEHSPKSEFDVEIKEYMGSDESSEALRSCGSLSASSRELNRLDVEESEQAEDFKADVPTITKCRYSSLKFLKSEVRPSYTADKLQKLHLLQYSIKKRTEAVQEIKDKIYKKSAIENCEELSPHGALIDNEDFSRSEKLSMSCREFSLFTGKSKTSSRSLGKLFSESNVSLQSSIRDLSKDNNEAVDEKRENKSQSLPPDKNSNNIRMKMPSNKYLENNLIQSDRRFTLPLNKLLEFKSQPSPSQRLRHSQLTRQAELSRFKRRLLQDERNAALAKLRKLRQEKCRIFEENQDNSTELMQNYHSLSRKSEQLRELKKSEGAMKELYQRSSSLLLARRWQLVQELLLIYPIIEEESGGYQILNISLPACRDNSDGLKQCSEADLAVALGRVAHATALAASLLGAPLRHPVRLMGSRTKVLDHVAQENESEMWLQRYDVKRWLKKWNFIPQSKFLPTAVFLSMYFSHMMVPLFARNKDSMMFRYGLFLLNRNIAQLLWATHRIITPDPRDTLSNLKKLLTPPTVTTGLDASRLFGSGSSMETTGTGTAMTGLIHPMSASSLMAISSSPRGVSLTTVHSHQSIRTMIPKQRHHRPFNRFKDSVDGTSPKAAMMSRIHRHSRSVGSYADEQNLQAMEMDSSVVGSEPSLVHLDSPAEIDTNDEAQQLNTMQENLIQNVISFSESDLTKVSDILSPGSGSSINNFRESKVVFSLGDDFSSTPDNSRKSPGRQLSKSRSLEHDDVPSGTELQDLKCDVDRLNQEIQVLCSDCENDSCDSAELLEKQYQVVGMNSINNDSANNLDFSLLSDCDTMQDVVKTKSKLRYDDQEFLLNVRSFESYENKSDESVAVISNIVPSNKDNVTTKSTKDEIYSSSEVNTDIQMCPVDIEKLGYPPFCGQPCKQKCSIEDCPKVLQTGYDQCKNGQEIMQDVIVLPSAEAVMTSSSHFTDSPLFDIQNAKQSTDMQPVNETPLNSEELVTLAKRVLKFENEETSRSILAVLQRSSIENENKTENEATLECQQNENGVCNCSCSETNSTESSACEKCCKDVDKRHRSEDSVEIRHKIEENVNDLQKSDEMNSSTSTLSCDCVSDVKSDIRLLGLSIDCLEGNERIVQSKNNHDLNLPKHEVNGYR